MWRLILTIAQTLNEQEKSTLLELLRTRAVIQGKLLDIDDKIDTLAKNNVTREEIVSKVSEGSTSWIVETNGCSIFFLQKMANGRKVEMPNIGDTVSFYGRNVGHRILGIAINGKRIC